MYDVTSPSDPAPIQARPAPRMHGIAEVAFRGSPDGTRLAGLYHRAPLRVLFPAPPEPGLATAVLVTTSGGLAGGDRLEARVETQEGAAAQITGQAAEKVYRSLGDDCRVDVHLVAGPGSWLEWLPQETIVFDGARLDRRTRIDRPPGGRVLAGEILVFGRAAHGERLRRGAVRDAWESAATAGWCGPMRWQWRAISLPCSPHPPASPAPSRWRRWSMSPTAVRVPRSTSHAT